MNVCLNNNRLFFYELIHRIFLTALLNEMYSIFTRSILYHGIILFSTINLLLNIK